MGAVLRLLLTEGSCMPDDERELPCECGGEFFLTGDYGETCFFTCDTCGTVEKVEYGW